MGKGCVIDAEERFSDAFLNGASFRFFSCVMSWLIMVDKTKNAMVTVSVS